MGSEMGGDVELKKQRVGDISCLLGVLFGFGEPRYDAVIDISIIKKQPCTASVMVFENSSCPDGEVEEGEYC
jgi:hypothetical protein